MSRISEMKGGREGGHHVFHLGQNLVVPSILRREQRGRRVLFLLFPLCLSSFSRPRKRHKHQKRMRTRKVKGGLVAFVVG